MFCTNGLPNDRDVRDVMAMKDLKEIISFFNKCKDNKKLANWRDVKLVCLAGIDAQYCCEYGEVLEEYIKTKKERDELQDIYTLGTMRDVAY